jgi:hypothetical protein
MPVDIGYNLGLLRCRYLDLGNLAWVESWARELLIYSLLWWCHSVFVWRVRRSWTSASCLPLRIRYNRRSQNFRLLLIIITNFVLLLATISFKYLCLYHLFIVVTSILTHCRLRALADPGLQPPFKLFTSAWSEAHHQCIIDVVFSHSSYSSPVCYLRYSLCVRCCCPSLGHWLASLGLGVFIQNRLSLMWDLINI